MSVPRMRRTLAKPRRSGTNPGPVGRLVEAAGGRVALGKERRREMDIDPLPALKLAAELPVERAVGEQAGDFVLVLHRHELEQAPRHRVGQRDLSGGDPGLGVPHAFDAIAIAGRIGRALIVGEERDAARDDVVERRAPAPGSARPEARSARLVTTSGSSAARRPQAKAALLSATSTPFSSIARSIASRDSGIAPACQARPSRKMLVAIESPRSAVGDARRVDDARPLGAGARR